MFQKYLLEILVNNIKAGMLEDRGKRQPRQRLDINESKRRRRRNKGMDLGANPAVGADRRERDLI